MNPVSRNLKVTGKNLVKHTLILIGQILRIIVCRVTERLSVIITK